MPLTISALTAPTDAAALLGERPFSGKMTNQVVNGFKPTNGSNWCLLGLRPPVPPDRPGEGGDGG
jgi:hypothetical protein